VAEALAYLSEAWLEAQRELVGALPERPGATATVQHVVSGGPDGEVRWVERIVDGRLTEVTLGDDPDADVTLTETYADAVQIARGELDANAAFMQGRVKVVGDMGKVMALMPLTDSDEYRAALAALAARTAF
jgi:predicted lipid carrier protein YhbT